MLLTEFIHQCLATHIPFVSYKSAATAEPVTMMGAEFSAESKPHQNQDVAFILASFDKTLAPIQFFYPLYLATGWEIDPPFDLKKKAIILPDTPVEKPVVTDFKTYELQAEKLIKAMQRHEFDKVVLSRVIEYPLPDDFCAAHIFEKACAKYPNAFVYLLHDGNGLVWLGATPESLLQVRALIGSTMALAGTQAIDDQQVENIVWGEKEIKEQAFVTAYIRDVLHCQGLENLTESGPISVAAGKMAHLQTNFSFQMSENQSILDIAIALHPTPAVCGIPQREAFGMILATENHKRQYYTGFLGIRNGAGDCQLYVNLRCMQIIDNKAYIYVGGGITALSDPIKEWDETTLKAGTMLLLLE